MGKRARNKIKENNPDRATETPEEGRLRAWWGRRKEKRDERIDDALNRATFNAQKKYYKQWMARSGCNHPNFIKWDDPHISLECKLCDIRNLKLIRGGAQREKFLEICTEEERDVYLNGVDIMGDPYTNLEDPAFFKSMLAGIKKWWRERKITLTDEELAQLNDLIEDGTDNPITDDD